MLSWKPKIFDIGKQYLFFHMYDHLGIPCLAGIFLFPYLCQYHLKLYEHLYIHKNTNAYEV